MRPAGWGVRDGNAGLAALPVTSSFQTLSLELSVLVKFSFSYNTLFLSSLGLMAAQYTPSGV